MYRNWSIYKLDEIKQGWLNSMRLYFPIFRKARTDKIFDTQSYFATVVFAKIKTSYLQASFVCTELLLIVEICLKFD